MKLKEFIKKYYDSSSDITTKSPELTNVYKELILPGAYVDITAFKKTIAWNLDRNLYFKEVTQESNSPEIYVTLTTGKMEFFVTFNRDSDFVDFIECGLKKHKGYRKENLNLTMPIRYLYYSKKYE